MRRPAIAEERQRSSLILPTIMAIRGIRAWMHKMLDNLFNFHTFFAQRLIMSTMGMLPVSVQWCSSYTRDHFPTQKIHLTKTKTKHITISIVKSPTTIFRISTNLVNKHRRSMYIFDMVSMKSASQKNIILIKSMNILSVPTPRDAAPAVLSTTGTHTCMILNKIVARQNVCSLGVPYPTSHRDAHR